MRQVRVVGIGLWVIGAAIAVAAPPVIPDGVKESIRKRVDFGYVPGMVVGMVNADGTTYFSYGKLTRDSGTAVGGNSLYEIASVTKTFTTVLLAEMVEAGDVSLNDKAGRFLPEGVNMPGGGGANITLKHLATHTSGLPNMPPNLPATIVDFGNQFSGYDVSDLYAFLDSYTLTRAPGAGHEYSNAGLGLLGHVLALSQEKTFEELLKERVLVPMGMLDTGLTLNEEQMARRAPGHHGVVERPKFEMNVLNPAGGLQSSADNLCSYLRYQLGHETGDISPALTLSHQKHFDLPAGPYDMGLGWWLWSAKGVIQHGGDSQGSTAFVGFKPSTGIGVVVLQNNRGHNSLSVSDLGFHCLNPSESLSEIRVLPSANESDLRKRVGRYEHPAGSVFQIGLKHGWLTLDIEGQTAYTLYHISSGVGFKLLDFGLDADVVFQPEKLTYSQNGGAVIPFDRMRKEGSLSLVREGGNLSLHLSGEGDVSYPVEWSRDLKTWQLLGNHTIWDAPHEETFDGAKYFRIGKLPDN